MGSVKARSLSSLGHAQGTCCHPFGRLDDEGVAVSASTTGGGVVAWSEEQPTSRTTQARSPAVARPRNMRLRRASGPPGSARSCRDPCRHVDDGIGHGDSAIPVSPRVRQVRAREEHPFAVRWNHNTATSRCSPPASQPRPPWCWTLAAATARSAASSRTSTA